MSLKTTSDFEAPTESPRVPPAPKSLSSGFLETCCVFRSTWIDSCSEPDVVDHTFTAYSFHLRSAGLNEEPPQSNVAHFSSSVVFTINEQNWGWYEGVLEIDWRCEAAPREALETLWGLPEP